MGQVCIGFDNQADGVTFESFGSWASTLPLPNLSSYKLLKKARTSDDATASTKFRFRLPAAAEIGILALAATNASVAAQYRWQVFSDSGYSVQTYDSGTLDLYPTGSMPAAAIHPSASNYATTKPLEADVARFQRNIVHVLSTAQYQRYVQFELTDTSNPDNYFEAGRLFVGKAFRPTNDPEFGDFAYKLTSRTTVNRARDGTPYFVEQRADMCLPFALNYLSEDEAMKLLDLQAIVDVHGEVLFLWDPSEVAYAFRRQVFGRLKQLDPIEHPMYAQYATAFQIEGQL